MIVPWLCWNCESWSWWWGADRMWWRSGGWPHRSAWPSRTLSAVSVSPRGGRLLTDPPGRRLACRWLGACPRRWPWWWARTCTRTRRGDTSPACNMTHDRWHDRWHMTHDACHMTHDAPAEEEVLVSKGPVEPEWVHGGEGHGEGGQQVGQRQVRHQDVPDSGARDWGVSTLTSDDDGRFILMSDIKGFKRLCKHQHSPKIPRIYSIKFKIWKVLAEYSDTPGAGPAPVPGAVEVWFPRHKRHQADVGHNWKHIQEFVTETEETKTLWMSDWWEDSLSWM